MGRRRRATLNGSRILIVDLVAEEVDELRRLLEARDCEIHVVPDGDSALTTIASGWADLVLIDKAAPGVSAYDICRILRAEAARAVPYIFLITDANDCVAIASAIRCGADGVLLRPIYGESFLAQLDAALTGGSSETRAVTLMERAVEDRAADQPRLTRALVFTIEQLVRINASLQNSKQRLATTHQTLERYALRLENEVELTDSKYRALMQGAGDAILVASARAELLELNERGERLFGGGRCKLLGRPLFEIFGLPFAEFDTFWESPTRADGAMPELVVQSPALPGTWLEVSASRLVGAEDELRLVIARDITDRRQALEELRSKEAALRAAIVERERIESELVQAQKLEAVGQLAAGIAHEINTPMQYIGDNIHFLRTASARFEPVFQAYQQLALAQRRGELDPSLLTIIDEAVREARLDYLATEFPRAIDQALEGVERVTTLVQAMKDFSHPGSTEKTPIDINRALQSTITVARNEWKYVAELELKLEKGLPAIFCLPGEFNQAILNIVVNAAHAIADKQASAGDQKGRIVVESRKGGDYVEVRISDTGCGIAAAIRDKVFNPFFTTKEVGRGTGQGLAIARSVIVDKHQGKFFFESREGAGTTFFIQLPT